MPKPDPNAALDAALARIAKLEENARVQADLNGAVARSLTLLESMILDLKSKKSKKT